MATILSMSERWALLEELYARIPAMECRGKCQGACGPIGMSEAEHRRIVMLGVPMLKNRGEHDRDDKTVGDCPALGLYGQCTVYGVRPMVCRVWGVVESNQCSHGCVPVGGWLPEEVAMALTYASLEIGEGRPMDYGTALKAFEHLRDPGIRRAWMNMQAAHSNPYSDNIRDMSKWQFEHAMRAYLSSQEGRTDA